MDANARNIGVIFDSKIQLTAPLFQRPYVWNRERNWEPLWETIQDVAERRLCGKPPRPRFLGAIVLAQLRTKTGEVEARQVIDGQQRLTTLQIALAAMRDLAGVHDSTEYEEAFAQLTKNHVPSKRRPESAFKVWPTNRDRPDFKQTMEARSVETLREGYGVPKNAGSCGHSIPDAYLFFQRQVGDWLAESPIHSLSDHPTANPDDLDSVGRRFECLWTAMRQDLILVVIDLSDKDDPQLIFETLNALGTPLLPADLVKNFLFHQAEDEKADVEGLYESCWKPFDDQSSYWRKEIKQGRLKRPRIDLYLQHYLTLKTKQEAVSTNLFGTFKDFVADEAPRSAADQLLSLRQYGDTYHSFDTYPIDSPEGRFFYRLRELDTTTVLPVLLEVFRHPTSLDDQRRIINDLESYLVRRALCGWTPKNYNRLFADLAKRISENEFSADEVREFLLERTGESGKWPTDQELNCFFKETPLYLRLKRARLRIVLEALENQMYDDKAEKIQIAEKLTIEHIMPQEWHKHWPLMDDTDGHKEDQREHLLHTIGNLSLVTKKLNPSMSHAAWPTKKQALLTHSALAMNRGLSNLDTWDEDCIRKRSEHLFALAVEVWPRPVTDKGDTPIVPLKQPSFTTKERHEIRQKYWNNLIEELSTAAFLPNYPSPPKSGNIRFSINRRHFKLRAFLNRSGRYIGVALVCEGPNAAEHAEQLKAEKDAIEADVGDQLLWDVTSGNTKRFITLRWNGVDPYDESLRPAQLKWHVEKLRTFYKAFDERCANLIASRNLHSTKAK